MTTAACVYAQAEDGFVYRGLYGLELPMHLVIPNAFGTKSGVEMGFCSTTTKRAVAVQYASQGRNPVIFRIRMGEVNLIRASVSLKKMETDLLGSWWP